MAYIDKKSLLTAYKYCHTIQVVLRAKVPPNL